MTHPICTSDTWGDVTSINGALDGIVFYLVCDLPRYRAAEPKEVKPQMMQACATARQCTLSHCFHRDEHQGGDGCRFSYSRCPPCVPVPEPVSAPKSEPAPVREIDRAELQRRIDVVRRYLWGMEREERDRPLHSLPAYGVGLLADLEALADGNARIEAAAGQKAWCPFARRTCLEWACGLCPEAVEWASEWARDCGWKEPK